MSMYEPEIEKAYFRALSEAIKVQDEGREDAKKTVKRDQHMQFVFSRL